MAGSAPQSGDQRYRAQLNRMSVGQRVDIGNPVPLSIEELRERLHGEDISPSACSIGLPQRDNCPSLVEESTGWRVYFHERGTENDLGILSPFSDASRNLLELLLSNPGASGLPFRVEWRPMGSWRCPSVTSLHHEGQHERRCS